MTIVQPEVKQKVIVNTYYRSLTKAITWRVIGTLDTIILSYIILGDTSLAMSIGFTELATKTLLFFLHERVWNKFRWKGGAVASHLRSITKSISWRVVGTVDTILIAIIYTHNPIAAFTIGGIETSTKIVLYYLHERVWHKIKWGIH
ncbi:MAG: DUF2061 domain-containing protein, partial [Fulvivirga sp.]|uniref:DUF2061 domain-containing protein n=1 Tax=Fulvivirga sp. TaxID=1931237 RepID=UPI0032EC3950